MHESDMLRRRPGRRPSRLLRALLLAGLAFATACGSGEPGAGGPPGKGGRPGGPGGGRPGGFGGAPQPETAVPVEVVEILPGAISAFIETNGTLEAESEVDIVARIGGPVVALATEEGRHVRAGDLLAQIDETEARAQVEIARVALQQAEVAYNRAQASLENSVISQEVYDAALSAFESAKAQLSGNEIQLGYTRITAPFDGLIIERAVKFGETVTAGQRLFRISDFDPLLCTIGVPERDLTRLSLRQPAVLEVEAFPGERFEGRVLRISPVVDAATGTIRVTLAVEGRGRLSPGMFAGVRLVTDVRENALIMPKRALSLESLADSVFVVEDGVAYRRNITLGYEEDDRVEVTEGLSANDRVIVVGQDGLTDATPVQILVGPGAEEPPTRRAGGDGAGPGAGAGSGMTEERRAAMRERMRARGMSDEQIDARLAAMEAGGGPPGGGFPGGRAGGRRPPVAAAPAAPAPAAEPEAPPAPEPEVPAAPEPGAAAASPATPDGGTAPEPAAAPPPAEPAAAPPAARQQRGNAPAAGSGRAPAAGSGRAPAAGSGRPPTSFESLPPETRNAIRARLRSMGLTEAQIEERVRTGWGPAPGSAPPPAGATEEAAEAPPSGSEPSPEQLEELRERLRSRGMTEEQIEEIIARRRRPR